MLLAFFFLVLIIGVLPNPLKKRSDPDYVAEFNQSLQEGHIIFIKAQMPYQPSSAGTRIRFFNDDGYELKFIVEPIKHQKIFKIYLEKNGATIGPVEKINFGATFTMRLREVSQNTYIWINEKVFQPSEERLGLLNATKVEVTGMQLDEISTRGQLYGSSFEARLYDRLEKGQRIETWFYFDHMVQPDNLEVRLYHNEEHLYTARANFMNKTIEHWLIGKEENKKVKPMKKADKDGIHMLETGMNGEGSTIHPLTIYDTTVFNVIKIIGNGQVMQVEYRTQHETEFYMDQCNTTAPGKKITDL